MTVQNLRMQKINGRYYLGNAEFNSDDPITLHPVVDKAGRQLTDDLMRELDVNAYEYADTADIDRARFRDWWAGEPGAQLTARDVYQIDQLNGDFSQGKIADVRERLAREEQLRQQAAAQRQEQNANLQADYERQKRWDAIYKNAAPVPKRELSVYEQQAREWLEAHSEKSDDRGSSSTV